MRRRFKPCQPCIARTRPVRQPRQNRAEAALDIAALVDEAVTGVETVLLRPEE